MDPQSLSTQSILDRLAKKREEYRAAVANALRKEADPLATYVRFIQWTEDNYPGELICQSGLLKLLEGAARTFFEDPSYKSDLRYFKIWAKYANLVDKPGKVFAFLVVNNIGLVFSQLYEECALALEREGSYDKADDVYRMGMKRKARPVDRLKKCYDDFRRRSKMSPRPDPPGVTKPICKWPAEEDALRVNPMRNFPGYGSPSSPPSLVVGSSEERYAAMLAPPLPGKRPEKLRFNLSLLWTSEHVEYSIQEARARSKGLLGKKWEPDKSSAFDDDEKTVRYDTASRKIGVREPTVTINTKEALADVFGMYNSPDKTMRYGSVPGSKHAPLKKIDPVAPLNIAQPQQSHQRASSNENANVRPKTPGTFRPYVDENADAGRSHNRASSNENADGRPKTPAFRPYVDENIQTKQSTTAGPSKTPDAGRRALSVKDVGTVLKPQGDEAAPAKKPPVLKPMPHDAVFSFTPASKDQGAYSRNASADEAKATTTPAKPFIPFRDAGGPFRVFSRPPDNAFIPRKVSASSDYEDEQPSAPPAPAPSRIPFGEQKVLQRAFTPQNVQEFQEVQSEQSDDSWDDRDEEVDEQPQGEDYDVSYTGTDSEDGGYGYQQEVQHQYQDAPLGGRFGQFDVMTPITERTFEFSTRALSTTTTPSSTNDRAFLQREANEAAEQLAKELQSDGQRRDPSLYQGKSGMLRVLEPPISTEESPDERSFDSFDNPSSPPFRVSDGHTIPIPRSEDNLARQMGAISLSDALLTVSSFTPSNPCNPFDPKILRTLLAISPPDSSCHDLREQDATLLDKLQKFTEKRAARANGNTSVNTSRLADVLDVLPVQIADRRFEVGHKLGEGGFGAVFAAKDVSMRTQGDDGDDDFDDDDIETPWVAIKVVRPRNLWEYHILRRIHCTLSSHLRRSVVQAQALYAFRDESFLVLDLCPQGTLLDVVNRAGQMSVSQQGACLDELLVVFFSIELMRLLEGLHNAGFIHGDLKIDNCLLRLEDVPGGLSAWASAYQPSGKGGWSYKGIKLIDFGRTIDTQFFPAGQQYTADWPADDRDCFEIREHRPWTYQTDYFGLAGIIYCLLFGKYLEKSAITASQRTYKLSTPFKRYWQTDLWTRLFDLLLNPCFVRADGKLPLCEELSALRKEMEIWLQENCERSSGSLRALLKKVEKFVNS